MPERNRIRTVTKGAAKPRSSFEWGSVKRPGNDSGEREEAFRRAIFAIPPGKVSSYGGVGAAAGYPRYHHAVARLLHQDHWDLLPWHRVSGADGGIKTSGASAREQKARLRAEGVSFEGKRVSRRAFLTLPMVEGDNHDAEWPFSPVLNWPL